MKVKKVFVYLLTAIMLVSFMPQTALAAGPQSIDLSTVSSGGNGYTCQAITVNTKTEYVVTITENGSYELTGTIDQFGDPTHPTHVIVSAPTADIYLNSVNVKLINFSPLSINPGSTVNLILKAGTVNTFSLGASEVSYPGVHVPYGASIVIGGTGTLNAYGGAAGNGAGIGGGFNQFIPNPGTPDAGNITINSGVINAVGGPYGAGIGGASEGWGGTVVINGGEVTARSTDSANSGGAGIGGGYFDAGEVTINGGTVLAISGNPNNTEAIGAGSSTSYGGPVQINGGSVRISPAIWIKSTPKNGSDTIVYLTTVTMPLSNTQVTCKAGTATYTAKTDGSGKLYLWLPAGNANILASSGSDLYQAGGTVLTDGTTALTAAAAIPNTVNIADISGVTAPVKGAAPVTAITETDQYTGTVTWSPDDDAFGAGTSYTARITLTPKIGYALTGVTADYFNVVGATTVSNGAGSGEITAVFPATAPDSQNNSGSSGGGGGGGSAGTSQTYQASVSGTGEAAANVPINVNTAQGSAVIDVSAKQGDIVSVGGAVTISVPSIPAVTSYTVGVPVSYLSKSDSVGTVTLKSEQGAITVPTDMLTGTDEAKGSKAEISMSQGNKSVLPDELKEKIGDRPLIQLALLVDGKQTEWNNPNASVTVSLPYKPTAAELAHPENIVIWYIDGSGKAVSIPNGHYDVASGMVTFSTNHFSYYAVGYSKVSFSDVAERSWYSKAVNFIAARGITTGAGNGKYNPAEKLTRGQFLVMVMRAYGIVPEAGSQDNFKDAGNTYYTDYLAAAKKQGISAGIGDDRFAPDKEISRQEMFTLLYNSLKVIGQLPSEKDIQSLTEFSDANEIDSWAKAAIQSLANAGIITGSNGKLLPEDSSSRAQFAQVLYNLSTK